MKNLSQKNLGILLAIFAYSIFAFTDVALKITSEVYAPLEVAFYMNIFTILFLIPVVFYCGGFKKTMKTKSLKLHALRSAFMIVNFPCIIYAFAHLPLTTVYVIIFCMPFVLNIMAMFFLREKISINRWVSIAIAFVGVLIALRPGYTPIGIGVILAGLGVLLISASSICTKLIGKTDHWLSYTVYLMAFQTPILAAIVLYTGGSLIPDLTDMSTLPWFIAAGALYVTALSFMPMALQKTDASIIGSLVYLVFPWGILYGYFIFNDVVDNWTLSGTAIIIISGIYLIYREKIEDSKTIELEAHKDHGTTH